MDLSKFEFDFKNYYDPRPVQQIKDLDGLEPDIYILSGNRSAGKTTGVLIEALEMFKNLKKKVALIYRHKYELDSAHLLFSDVIAYYAWYGRELSIKSIAKGAFYEIFLDKKSIGYSLALVKPDTLKKYSPLFRDIEMMIMDEFQTEDGDYLPKEVDKLQSVVTSIARGGGKQSRPIKLFLIGNMVSMMNPYFIEFEIYKRLRADTHYLRGHGWVAEFSFNKTAAEEVKKTGFYRAFKHKDYMQYVTESVYLYDAKTFVEPPKGKMKYWYTIKYGSKLYGVRQYYNDGVLYISQRPDKSCSTVITFKPGDHNQNTLMMGHCSYVFKGLSEAFNQGILRFDNIGTKNDIFDVLSINYYK